ncbi:MAG: isochorismatase hydrolase [Thermoleophilia bacterium]|nr:isochorismatase hydrolase [Thermoleophilia bacterium]
MSLERPVSHPLSLLGRERTAVFVIDVQERFRPHIHEFDALARSIRLLVEAATVLGVPTAYSEQYPEGLGATVDEIRDVMPEGAASFAKLEISSAAAAGWSQLPSEIRDAEQLVLVGIEAHVCVRQTALDLLHQGRSVHVPVDAVSSRGVLERDTAVRDMERSGARIATVEQVLFDWLGVAGSPEFRAVQSLIRARDAAAAGATAR